MSNVDTPFQSIRDAWLGQDAVPLSKARLQRALFNRLDREVTHFIGHIDNNLLGKERESNSTEPLLLVDASAVSHGDEVVNRQILIRVGAEGFNGDSANNIARKLQLLTGESFAVKELENSCYQLSSKMMSPDRLHQTIDTLTNFNAQHSEIGNPVSRSFQRMKEDGGPWQELLYRERQLRALVQGRDS